MRVIDQARLWFREGTSDKIYEVDLVEVATNQYVVNFRFGRRGTPLKDGTKTALPLALDKARGVFQKLVDEKLAGGYKVGSPPAGAPTPSVTSTSRPVASPNIGSVPGPDRGEAARLIGYLRQGGRSDVPLGPVMWRIADRDLTEAEPAVLELLSTTFVPRQLQRMPAAWRHLMIFALARCGTRAAIEPLASIADSGNTPPHLRDLARLAISRIDPQLARERARQSLPRELAALYDKGDAPALARAVEELLATDAMRAKSATVALYLANDAVSRPAVLAVARIARLSNVEASIVRTLFRFAEVRRDGELYALVARRIDAYTGHTRPFSLHTRQYLRRRVARYLRRLGRVRSPDYVRMAQAILLGYDDEDAVEVKRGNWRATYPEFAPFHAFNQILYTNSPRFRRAHHTKSVWRIQDGYRGNTTPPPPTTREEAFPFLWDQAPSALWELILKSGCTPVVEFATKALRDNTAFCASLTDEQLASVMATGHPLAQRFGFDIARTRPISALLARGALASEIAEAHSWVVTWVDANPDQAAADPDLVALIVTGRTAQIREAALRMVRSKALDINVAKSAAARSLAILLGLSNTPQNAERASGALTVVLRLFEGVLKDLSPDILRDMVKHPLAALGELGGELIMRHTNREQLPGDLIEAMLSSPHATVRLLGGRLLAMTPIEVAKDDLEALYLFCTSGNAELREGTRTLIGKIAQGYPDVGMQLADRLIDALMKTQPLGAPAHIVSLLRAELAGVIPKKPPQTILKLISALSPHARDAGGLLLPQLGPDDIGLDDIGRLASNENRMIREGAWALAKISVPRYRLAPVALAKLLDSQWEDTRAFAIDFIKKDVGGDKLSADAIITICDSIRPEVQELGKQLFHEHFRDNDAGKYLVRLAEHPSANLQLLVSALLDRHATNAEKLAQLVPFFATILSQVNRGRIAKERVIALLRREAQKSAEIAAVLAPLLDRQSATMAITQKHPIIATMVEVHHLYPEVPLPIRVATPKGAQ